MKWIVFVFAAIAVAGIVALVKIVKDKASTPREVYAPKLVVCITLTVIFTIMTVMTTLFTK
jgi:hypothetical protein